MSWSNNGSTSTWIRDDGLTLRRSTFDKSAAWIEHKHGMTAKLWNACYTEFCPGTRIPDAAHIAFAWGKMPSELRFSEPGVPFGLDTCRVLDRIYPEEKAQDNDPSAALEAAIRQIVREEIADFMSREKE